MALEPTLARFATLARFVTAAGAADMVIVSLGWFAALYLSGVAGVAWLARQGSTASEDRH